MNRLLTTVYAVRSRYEGLCNDQYNLLARVPWARVLGSLTGERPKITGGQIIPLAILKNLNDILINEVVRLALVEILINEIQSILPHPPSFFQFVAQANKCRHVQMARHKLILLFRSDHNKPGVLGRAVFAGRVPCLSTRDEPVARSLELDPIGLAHCNEEEERLRPWPQVNGHFRKRILLSPFLTNLRQHVAFSNRSAAPGMDRAYYFDDSFETYVICSIDHQQEQKQVQKQQNYDNNDYDKDNDMKK